MADKKNGLITLIIMGAAFTGIVIVAFYFLYLQYAESNRVTALQNNNQNQQSTQTDVTAGWNTVTNNEMGFSFKYPNGFFDAGHDPKILVGDCNYQVFPASCPNIDGVILSNSPGIVTTSGMWQNPSGEKTDINGTTYCLYKNSEGAAGHVYAYYYYATVKNQKCLVVNMDTSSTNCDNYLQLEPGNVQQQQNYNDCIVKNQNMPVILNQITNTFNFAK